MGLAIFIITAAVAIVAAILVIVQRNPIASVLFLVTSFIAQAILFIQLHAAFVAVLQIIVYAGAIMVLFLFVIMLLNLRREDFGKDIKLKLKPLAIAFAGVLVIETIVVINASLMPSRTPASLDVAFGSVHAIGRELFTTYLYPFELTSVLLIVAVLGAVVMAKKKI